MAETAALPTMRKPIEVWQFIVSLMVLIIMAGTMIVNQSNKITSQGDRIIFLEQATQETKATLHEISGKLTDILVALNNKKDREK